MTDAKGNYWITDCSFFFFVGNCFVIPPRAATKKSLIKIISHLFMSALRHLDTPIDPFCCYKSPFGGGGGVIAGHYLWVEPGDFLLIVVQNN